MNFKGLLISLENGIVFASSFLKFISWLQRRGGDARERSDGGGGTEKVLAQNTLYEEESQMKKNVMTMVLALSLLCLPVLLMAQTPTLSSPDPWRIAVNRFVPKQAALVLWDQPLSGSNLAAYASQDFPDYPSYSIFGADDFQVDVPWFIEVIYVPGDFWNGGSSFMNATSLNWQIYQDAGGVPDGDPSGGGNPPVWSLSLAPTDPQVSFGTGTGGYPSDVTLTLNDPIFLPPGTYWLTFFPTMSFGTGGQYGRQVSDTTNGSIGKFINPGGGFGLGTTWTDMTVIGTGKTDYAFRLEGSFGVFSEVTLVRPNGGQLIPTGSTYKVIWGAPEGVKSYRLNVSFDGGTTWKLLANQYADTSFNWRVPLVPNNKTKCLMSVEGFDESGILVGKDTSDDMFTLEVVRLTSPNGGETWFSGNPYAIQWVTRSTKGTVKKVKLSYTKDGGTTWIPIITLTGNPESYEWTIPPVTAEKAKCKVRVVLKDSAGNTLGSDVGDDFFTLSPNVPVP